MKFLRKYRQFFSGMAAMCLILVLATSALATTGTKSIQAVYNNLKIYVNDVLLTPKDANGKTVEPFAYNGTTYLPARALAEALGQSVVYDSKTASVFIGTHKASTFAKYLSDVEPITTGGAFGTATSPKDNLGVTYKCALTLSNDGRNIPAYAEYVLNGNYSRFTGLFSLANEYKNLPEPANFYVYGDGVLLYTSPDLLAGVEPIAFDVDISGVSRLLVKMVVNYNNNDEMWNGRYTYYVLNPSLYT